MNKRQQALRTGAMVVLAAVLLRLICSGLLGGVLDVFAQPELASWIIRAETGRDPDPTLPEVTAPPTEEPTAPPTEAPTEAPTTPPTEPPTEPPAPVDRPSFSASDVKYTELTYGCTYRPDLETLLTQSLKWDLTGEKPTILIIHTHGTEAYTETPDSKYEEFGGEFRTLDDRYNLISIGDELTRLLEAGGLSVIHDRTPHDKNDYLDAYDNSREAVKKWLAEYPSIKMILDLHRDAAEYADGTQWATSGEVNGQKSSQIMFVVGTDARGLTHPNWKTNLSIAQKLNVLLERSTPGISRNINLRGQRFNQDQAMGALIVEVGSAGNTHAESILAMTPLAQAILELAQGSE